MRVIACVGFHRTGSGVVDDIFKEFDNCISVASNLECRFLQDPDGISDLEYNLIDNPHRLNSGFALKRYLKYVERYSHTYKMIFGNKWKEISVKYIDSLISVKYKGFWYRDLSIMKRKALIAYYIKRVITLIRHPKKRIFGYYVNCPNEDFYHCYIPYEDFLKKTKLYVSILCGLINNKNYPFLLLDQCVPTSNIHRYVKYFDDIKIVIVDRDPRDLYIEHKKRKDHVLPNTVLEFCKVYKEQRELFFANNYKDILYMKFEDFIYNYRQSIDILIDYVGEDRSHHVKTMFYFNPHISVKNTQLWKKYPMYIEEVYVIEKELSDYLYNFPNDYIDTVE